MSPTAAFLADIAIATLACIGIESYLGKQLRLLLIELCGTVERASFWLAFSNVALVLVPLIFALNYKPDIGPHWNVVFAMAEQLRSALVGFVVTLSVLALVLYRFIPRTSSKPAAHPVL